MAIRFERDGAVGSIVLANPPFNRLDLRFAEALRIAVHQASESDIRVLVVRSEGPHFSFGGELREWPGKDVNWFRTFVAKVNAHHGDGRYLEHFNSAIRGVYLSHECSKPIDLLPRPFAHFAAEAEVRTL